jgi:hypothetical protein
MWCLGAGQRGMRSSAAWAKAKGAEGESPNGLVVATTCFADPDNDVLHWTVNVQYGPP